MKVRFKTNLGSIDAKTYGLDHKDCEYQKEVEVSEETGKKLIELGIAEAATLKAPAKAPAVAGVK